jgi:hypothetical protein
MFGHPRGTEIARQMEAILSDSAPDTLTSLTALVTELRDTLFPSD